MKKYLCDFPLPVVVDVLVYVGEIETQSPIVSTSHAYLHAMVKKHGEIFHDAVAAYFRSEEDAKRGRS
jgi:hypothetical protein